MFRTSRDKLKMLTNELGEPLEGVEIPPAERKLYPKGALTFVHIASLNDKRGIYAYCNIHFSESSDELITSEVVWHDCVLPLALALNNAGFEDVFVIKRRPVEGNNFVHEIGVFIPFDIIQSRKKVESFINRVFIPSVRETVNKIYQIVHGTLST